ncbi:MAG: NAD-dependent DNA ligase LigA, partial [Elusimicrobia bacterium]|nr:NAD-dependent DNA ligase LigA [Elusimicrobiota bacterium]
PVFLSGVTISSVSLHNFEEVERLDARLGDTVVIERAGEAIPKVVKVVVENRPRGAKAIRVPRACPVCAGAVQREGDAVAFRCASPACPAQLKRGLLHFASRDGLDIEGFGDAVVDQLVDSGRVRSLADVFGLSKADLLKLELFAEKRADNLLEAVAAAKARPLSRLLFALGIPQVGEKTARDLAAAFRRMRRVLGASREELLKVPDVGPVVADSIAAYFGQPAARELVAALEAAGLEMTEPESALPQDSRLAGKTFVFTGELESMTRPEAEEKVRLLGAKASGSVSAKTSFVVVGAEAGSKADKARKLGVTTLSEAEFLELLK